MTSENEGTDCPSTIDDAAWASLQDRARRADPRADSLTDPETIRRRKASGEQFKNRKWS